MTAEFRRAEPDDRSQILDLINLVQPSVPWTEDLFTWQYLDAPAGEAALFVGSDGGEIVSFIAAPRYTLSFFGETREAWILQDAMTHPDHRKRGYLHDVGALCLADLRRAGAVGYIFPNERAQNSYRRNGWTELGTVPLRSCVPGRAQQTAPATLIPVDRFPDSVGGIWADAGLPVGVERSAAYLEWRYAKPTQQYTRYVLPSEAGALVLKEYRSDSAHNLHICDLFVHQDARDEIPGILAAVFGLADAAGARQVTAWLPRHHPYAAHFDAAGIVLDETHALKIFVDSPEGDLDRLSEMRNWHIAHGDSDVY